ncbi:MAG: TonB-dependent receptor domain-containing protein [Rhodothermaceae bacterium]
MSVKSFAVVFLFTFALLFAGNNAKTCTIHGKITNEFNESLPNCNVMVKQLSEGTASDASGYYSLKLSPGKYTLEFKFVGYQNETREITISEGQTNLVLNIKLKQSTITQETVTVTGDREELTISAQKLESMDIHNMPTVYSDVLRSIKILPGVTSNNELSTSYNVRGGNYDENLIYLNGYEIYRPFLLRKGVEENQSLVNPDMVQDLSFYGGGFPARFGDKLSSALEVKYKTGKESKIQGKARADLLNAGLTFRSKYKNLSWTIGGRYAYPGIFLDGLQTKGDFNPSFYDVQAIVKYDFSKNTNLEFFGIHATNKFDLTPKDWVGNFHGFSRLDFRELKITFDGNKDYNYTTQLFGLRLSTKLSDNSLFKISGASYYTKEEELIDLKGDVFYSENAQEILGPKEFVYIKRQFEKADNHLELKTYEIQSSFRINLKNHSLLAGFVYKTQKYENSIDEKFWEIGDSLILTPEPEITKKFNDLDLNSYSGYIQDVITFSDQFQLNLGVRASYYDYNEETLISPRVSAHYYYSPVTTFRFSAGYYAQQPFIYELRSVDDPKETRLKSQKSIHFIAGWEQKFLNNTELNVEAYYKKLDDILPYHIDDVKLVYEDKNSNEGYAFGLDVLLKGEVIPGTRNWIGYSYLNSKERKKGTSEYTRRLLDQTHTLQLFIQDKGKKNKNIQSHLRVLVGSGFLYHPRTIGKDADGNEALIVDNDKVEEFSRFFRADMGVTWRTTLKNGWKLVIVAEVLNVFNNKNALSYSFQHVIPGSKVPFRVPHLLSRQTFNIGAQLTF